VEDDATTKTKRRPNHDEFVRMPVATRLVGSVTEVLAVDIRTAARMLAVGTRTVELLIATGQLASLHIGRCRRIRRVDLEDYLARRLVAEVELDQVHVEALPAGAQHLVDSGRGRA
jgi:excisionase family DNA binding protein